MVPSGLSSDQTLCQWTEGPRKFAIHLAPGVIGPLGAESKMAFKRVPRRGLEIGGILLGRKETEGEITTFSIEGFQPIESEHRTGPSYLLSESDYVLLQAALAKNGGACIGLYRSHTRSDRPRLQEADTELFERCFEAGDALYLVLGPVAGVADLFVRTNSALRCVHEFAVGIDEGVDPGPPGKVSVLTLRIQIPRLMKGVRVVGRRVPGDGTYPSPRAARAISLRVWSIRSLLWFAVPK